VTTMGPKKLSSSDFALYLIEALSDSAVQDKLQTTLRKSFDYDDLADKVSQRFIARINKLEAALKEKEEVITSLAEKVESLELKVDDLEQYSRRSSVRISGIKEEADEYVIGKVATVITALGLTDVTTAGINRAHRVGPKPEQPLDSIDEAHSRQILVQFKDYPSKAKVMKARASLKTAKPGVYINEDLTRRRSELLYKVRQLKKAKRISDCWSTDGRVVIKDHRNKINVVMSEDALTKLTPNLPPKPQYPARNATTAAAQGPEHHGTPDVELPTWPGGTENWSETGPDNNNDGES